LPEKQTYVLITQCLQNDFFLSLNCRLVLPKDAAGQLLVHPESMAGFGESGSRRTINEKTLLEGPLGRFLAATVGRRLSGDGEGTLHLVNIRDWHTTGDLYDRERRVYGNHCVAGTWGAEYLQGLTGLLDPGDTRRRKSGLLESDSAFSPEGFSRGSAVVHHVHSDSLFDLESHASGSGSELAEVLNRIVTPENRDNVWVAVIGVYTDIKVQILLQSLRVRYNPDRLVVSDSLTASPTLDRHLRALDFIHNILGIEVMHGVAELARFLGSDPGEDEQLESLASEAGFADAPYARDKQSIVSYEDSQIRSYRQMTGRLRETVMLIKLTNIFLIGSGILTVGSTVVLAVFAAIDPSRLPIALPAAILGVSLAQLITIFINRPAQALTRMLSREAVFRMALESRSLRMALLRYHLTTPTALRGDADASKLAQVVREQLRIVAEFDKVDFDRFDSLGDTGVTWQQVQSDIEAQEAIRQPRS
jgi:nicotinamidase-related amidase